MEGERRRDWRKKCCVEILEIGEILYGLYYEPVDYACLAE